MLFNAGIFRYGTWLYLRAFNMWRSTTETCGNIVNWDFLTNFLFVLLAELYLRISSDVSDKSNMSVWKTEFLNPDICSERCAHISPYVQATFYCVAVFLNEAPVCLQHGHWSKLCCGTYVNCTNYRVRGSFIPAKLSYRHMYTISYNPYLTVCWRFTDRTEDVWFMYFWVSANQTNKLFVILTEEFKVFLMSAKHVWKPTKITH